jgi:hypothetical protein
MSTLTDYRRCNMKKQTRGSMKIILLTIVLFFSCVAYGHSQLVTAKEVKEHLGAEETQETSLSELDLVGWWPGDGNTDDIVGANHGMLEGGTTFVTGQFGQAFRLDGVDDSVDFGNASNLHVSAGDFTVSAWVLFNELRHPPGENIEAPEGDMSIVDKMSPSGVNENGWRLIKQNDNRFWFCLGGGDLGNMCHDPSYTVFSTTQAVTGVWYHVAAVKSSDGFVIYVNGVLEDERSTVPSFNDTNSANLRIGSYPLEGAHLNGLVDEVQIYNRALSGEQIQAIYESGCAGMCKRYDGAIEGTIGTQITITGSDFGTKRGKVTVGAKLCKVSQWANESITCEIKAKLFAGTYDVIVLPLEPKGAELILYEKAFTMMAPEILSVDPRSAPTREIEVAGIYFGTKKGTVYLVNPESGKKIVCRVSEQNVNDFYPWPEPYEYKENVYLKRCRVKEWIMDQVTGESKLAFVVRRRLRSGTYGVEVVNKVGKVNALFMVD